MSTPAHTRAHLSTPASPEHTCAHPQSGTRSSEPPPSLQTTRSPGRPLPSAEVCPARRPRGPVSAEAADALPSRPPSPRAPAPCLPFPAAPSFPMFPLCRMPAPPGGQGGRRKGPCEENGVADDMRADPGQTGAQTPGTSARVPPQAPVPCEPQEAADPQTGFAGASRAGLSGVGDPPSRPYLIAPRRAASGGDLPFGVTAATCTSGGDPDFLLTPLPFP